MKEEIRKLGDKANKAEIELYNAIIALNNHMNECSCDGFNRVWYSFVNTRSHYEIQRFCGNCGGYIDTQ